MGWACPLMTQTRPDREPGGVSELGHKSLTVESTIAFLLFLIFLLHTGELQVSVNSGRCRLEGMVQRDWMGGHRDALSIDYHTEQPCAFAGLRLCRRTKAWFSTSFPRGRALETKDGGHLPPHPPTSYPMLLSLPSSVSISLSPACNMAMAMHQREVRNNVRAQTGIWLFFFFFFMVEVCHILGGQSGPGAAGENLILVLLWFLSD